MIRPLMIAAIALGAAACSPQGEKPSNAAPAAPALLAPSIEPGWYSHKLTLISMDNPMIPPSVKQMMMKNPTVMTVEDCISAAKAKEIMGRPRPGGPDGQGLDCGDQRYTVMGGRITGEVTCQSPMGPMTMRADGAYTATSMKIRMEMTGTTPQGPMTQTSEMDSTRLRACTAAEEAEAAKE